MDVGETLTLVPLPAAVPPQLPLYHFQAVASFKVPVDMLSVVLAPEQMLEEVDANVGTVGLLQAEPIT